MTHRFPQLFLFLVLGLASACCVAEDGVEVRTTTTLASHDQAKGSELSPRYKPISELVVAEKLDEAAAQARNLRADFEALFDTKLAQYCFQTKAEYEEFIQDKQISFEWIDWTYCLTLKAQAFIAAERGQYGDALMQLRTLEVVAPLSAGTLTETAFALGRLQRKDEALALYRNALVLARKFKSQAAYQPIALRGIGFMLVEVGKLDEAEQAYKDSLQLDPGNKIAESELAYIRQVRARKS